MGIEFYNNMSFTKSLSLLQQAKPSRPRNSFDLSQRHFFTAPSGALLPILTLDAIPHDHFEINASDFMRCAPMQQATFTQMRGVYEFFFVPYSQLFHPFDQFITSMADYNSMLMRDRYGVKAPMQVPCTSIANFITSAQKLLTTSGTDVDIFGFSAWDNFKRLFDLLGYGDVDTYIKWQETNKKVDTRKVNYFRFTAYQKIYQDYYRHAVYEPYDCSSFSLDNGSVSSTNFQIFSLRYRNALMDLITNTRPTLSSYTQDIAIKTGSYENLTSSDPYVQENISPDVYNNKLSLSSLRGALAIEKLLRATARSGKTYAEQIKAHFGVDVPIGRDGRVEYLGGFDSQMQVNDVTNTSGNGSSNYEMGMREIRNALGYTVGKGISCGNGSIKYDAKEHGIIMCIYSLVPSFAYDYSRLDPFVRKTVRADYFTPEFEDLGLQPALASDVCQSFTNVYGFQPRYSEYKTALDINHGQFSDMLQTFTTNRQSALLPASNATEAKYTLPSVKIDPKLTNSVFFPQYNGSQTTDCVFGCANFRIVKVSDMSTIGEPRL